MPTRKCIVAGCGASGAGVKLWPFPTSMSERQCWIDFIRNCGRPDWDPSPSGRDSICSKHFVDDTPSKDNPPTVATVGEKKAIRRIIRSKIDVLNIGETNSSEAMVNDDSEISALSTSKEPSENITSKFFYSILTNDSSEDIFETRENLCKRKRPSNETPSENAEDHCYPGNAVETRRKVTEVDRLVEKKSYDLSYTLSSDENIQPLATSSQPSDLLKLYIKKTDPWRRCRSRIEDVKISTVRRLALMYLKR